MKITTRDTSTKKILLIAGVVALLSLVTLAVLEKTQVTDFIKSSPTTADSGPTKEERQTQDKTEQDQKQDFIESPDPIPPQPSTPELELTARQEVDKSVTVLSKIRNAANGTCNLTITNDASSYTQSADIIYQPDFSSCAGFSIPQNKLGPGEWTIKLSVTTTETLEKVTTLKVN